MVSAPKPRTIALAVVASGATALLLFWGAGLDARWPLVWLAPIPVLLFALHGSWRTTALVAGLAWLAGCLNMWPYLRLLHTPFVGWLAGFGLMSLVFAAAVLLFRGLANRGRYWSAVLAFPAAWVTYEYVRTINWPHGTAGSLAYTQLKFLPVLQLASITGPWGISFLLFFLPAGVALALHLRRSQPAQAKHLAIGSFVIFGAVLVFGAVRLAMPQQRDIRVGLITSDRPGNVLVAKRGADTERLLRLYAEKAEQLAADGAQVIVIPEKIAAVVTSDSAAPDAILQQVSDRAGVIIVAGVVDVTPGADFNQARVYTPRGQVQTYDKEHLLPAFESDLKPGTALLTLPHGPETWGVAICKDMDFTGLSRKYGRDGVGLMLVPGWDFDVDRAWHGHIAIMRGVEDGFSIARAAKDGYLTVTDDRGRLLGEVRSDSGDFPTLLVGVPAQHQNTVYLWAGNWFAWCAIALLVFALMDLARARDAKRGAVDSARFAA